MSNSLDRFLRRHSRREGHFVRGSRGEIFTLIGANGAGKTSTLRALSSQLRHGGTVKLFAGICMGFGPTVSSASAWRRCRKVVASLAILPCWKTSGSAPGHARIRREWRRIWTAGSPLRLACANASPRPLCAFRRRTADAGRGPRSHEPRQDAPARRTLRGARPQAREGNSTTSCVRSTWPAVTILSWSKTRTSPSAWPTAPRCSGRSSITLTGGHAGETCCRNPLIRLKLTSGPGEQGSGQVRRRRRQEAGGQRSLSKATDLKSEHSPRLTKRAAMNSVIPRNRRALFVGADVRRREDDVPLESD